MFKNYFVKRKIQKFIISMSYNLSKNYGVSKEYTEGQVKTMLKTLGYSTDLEEVAIGIFCNEEIAKAYGMDVALIKKYRGYPREYSVGVGGDGNSGGFGGDVGGE